MDLQGRFFLSNRLNFKITWFILVFVLQNSVWPMKTDLDVLVGGPVVSSRLYLSDFF